jgi:hypothetical protein
LVAKISKAVVKDGVLATMANILGILPLVLAPHSVIARIWFIDSASARGLPASSRKWGSSTSNNRGTSTPQRHFNTTEALQQHRGTSTKKPDKSTTNYNKQQTKQKLTCRFHPAV